MEPVLALVVGVLFACSVFLLLQRKLAQLVIGFGLLTSGTNLLVFTAAGLTRDAPPVLPPDGSTPPAMADPLPQAIVLTAIVIGFAVTAFVMVLAYATYREAGTDDLDELTTTDELEQSLVPGLVDEPVAEGPIRAARPGEIEARRETSR